MSRLYACQRIQCKTYEAYVEVVNDVDAARVGFSRLPIVDSA